MRQINNISVRGDGNEISRTEQTIVMQEERPEPLSEVCLLFVSAGGALELEPVQSERELSVIQAAVQGSTLPFRVAFAPAASSFDLQRALLFHRPEIVHLSGHGTKSLAFLFDDDAQGDGDEVCDGKRRRLRARGFMEMLASDGRHVRLVVFNSCDSWPVAKRIAPSVGAVIGMKGEISDQGAIDFSQGLYQSLAAGESLRTAFSQGTAPLAMRFPSDHPIPTLEAGREAAEHLRFVPRVERHRSP